MALMKELQEFCETNDEFIPSDMVEIGDAFAAKNPDGYFHRYVHCVRGLKMLCWNVNYGFCFRVTVVKKIGDMIHVSFCDFGDIAIVQSSQLKTLPLKLRQLPKMAIQAKLHGKFFFFVIFPFVMWEYTIFKALKRLTATGHWMTVCFSAS